MPSKADAPCTVCGATVWRGTGSLPEPTCRKCRRARWPRCTRCGKQMPSSKAPNPVCKACRDAENDEIRRKGERICRICGQPKPLTEYGTDKRYQGGQGLRSAICNRCQAATRPKTWRDMTNSKLQSRRRRSTRRDTWDGVPDQAIFDRDGWECQMPRCLRPEGRGIPKVIWPDPWSPSIDHIVPLGLGGSDGASNKRAAHLRCNVSAGRSG